MSARLTACLVFGWVLFASPWSVVANAWGENYEQCIDRGFIALDANKPVEAEAAFKQALEKRPKDAEATSYLGLALYKQKFYLFALNKFEEALLLDRSIFDSSLYYRRALCVRQLGLIGQERKAWHDLIKNDPPSPNAERGRKAIADLSTRKPYASPTVWRKGQEVGANYPHAALLFYIESIEAMLAAGKFTELKEPLSNLLNTLNRIGQSGEVRNFEDVVAAIQPTPPEFYLDLAIARVSTGQCEAANKLLAKLADHQYPLRRKNIQQICETVHSELKTQRALDRTNFHVQNYRPDLHNSLLQQGVPLGLAPSPGGIR